MRKTTAAEMGIGGQDVVKLTIALDLSTMEIAAKLGVTYRTVLAWITGARRPSERNRVALVALVDTTHREHSAAGRHWSASRDRSLCEVKLQLMTATQRAKWEADRDEMRAAFAAPAARPESAPADDLLALLAA